MTQATTRPTAAQLQQNQAKADRKAAAIARRQDDYRQDAERTTMYQQIKNVNIKLASVNRRLQGRLIELAKLGQGNNDAHLYVLQALSARYTNQELLNMYMHQNDLIGKVDAAVRAEFPELRMVVQEGITDDCEAEYKTPWAAWFIEDQQVAEVKNFVNRFVFA